MTRETVLQKKWFICPECNKAKLCMTDERARGGVFIKCKLCGKEVEVKHQST
jgi:transcription elongation factor Elf1